MLLAAAPNWLGSPQHFVGGLVLAFLIVIAADLGGVRTALACALAVGLTSMAEILVELAEYPLKHSGKLHPTAYYDTLADMGNTLVGAVAGAAIGVYLIRARNRRRSQRVPTERTGHR